MEFHLIDNEVLILALFFQTALHVAVVTGNRAVIDCLVTAHASPDLQDRNGNSAVHLAVSYGSQPCLTALLKAHRRPDWDLKNYDGTNFRTL